MRQGRFARFQAVSGAMFGGPGFAFLACLAVCFLIVFARNPDPYFHRILYAEDGGYQGLIRAEGFWPAVWKARSDYYVFGNIAVAWLGIRACDLVAGGDLFVLPAYLACASYLFFAAVAALPVLLLRGRIPVGWLMTLAILTAFLPLDGQDNEVLGRIANTGYSWLYVAFLAVVRRGELVGLPARSRGQLAEIVVLDGLLAVSVATNPIALALLPAVFLSYGKRLAPAALDFRRGRSQGRWDLASALAMVVACLPVLARIAMKDRLMHEPIQSVQPTLGQAVELTVARGLLFAVVHPFYNYLNTPIVLGLLGLLVLAFLTLGRRRNRSIYLVGSSLLLLSTAALGSLRTELYVTCVGYQLTYPLRYVLGQNTIALCLLAVLAWDVASNPGLPRLVRLAPIVLAAGLSVDLPRQLSFGSPTPPFNRIGDLSDQVAQAMAGRQFCNQAGDAHRDGDWLKVRSYPVSEAEPGLSVLIKREDAEKALLRRAGRRRDFDEAIAVVRQEQVRRLDQLARGESSGSVSR